MFQKIRFENIDVSKGILIIIVVLSHAITMTSGKNGLIQNWFSSFDIPAFFLLSGLLFNYQKWRSAGIIAFTVHRIQSLLIPYVFFDVLGGIIQHVLSGGWKGLNAVSIIKDILLLGYNTATLHVNVAPHWFLFTLFFAELLLYAFITLSGKFRGIVPIILFSFILGFLLVYKEFNLIPASQFFAKTVLRCLLAFVFQVIGYWGKPLFLKSKYKVVFVLLAFIISFSASVLMFGRPRMSQMKFNSIALFILSGCTGSYFIIGLSSYIHNHIIIYIGQNTLCVMVTHYVIRNLLVTHPNYSYPIPWYVFLLYLFIVTLFSIVFIPLSNKLFPCLIGKKQMFSIHKKVFGETQVT